MCGPCGMSNICNNCKNNPNTEEYSMNNEELMKTYPAYTVYLRQNSTNSAVWCLCQL